MRQSSLLIFTVLLVQAYSAPQFITFNEGKLGVNFGGYHAGVGLGGVAGGKGRTAGGLYAEAGTPFGPAARAGLGGSVDGDSGTAGGLFAGATAGGNVNAAAGIGGAVGAGKAVGGGYSTANAGGHSASSALGGESGASGSSGFSISAHKSVGVPITVVKEKEVSVVPVEEVKTVHKKVDSQENSEASNEITPGANAGVEVNVEPIPTQVIVHKHKAHRPHIHKTVYLGGYLGAGGQPIDKRIDIEAQGGSEATVNGQYFGPGKDVSFSNGHEVVVSSNAQVKPNTFFQDIFNIPISTLKAVSGFLSNTAENTNISVQKSASVHADTDLITSKHVPSSSSSSSSDAHISVQTPSASKFIDDIFSIPINTLSAVNKFLENNVSARKRVQVTAEGTGEPTKVRLGPHARRRANKHVVIVQETPTSQQAQESN